MDDPGRTPPSSRGIGTLSVGELAGLWAVLVLGLVLRMLGIGWGLPPATPVVAASGFRGSYAPGEGGILGRLAPSGPKPGEREVSSYRRCETLHLELTWLGLEFTQRLDFFDGPWGDAYRRMQPGVFERTFMVGRLESGVMDLVTLFLLFLLGREVGGAPAGLWTAAIAAVAPGHLLAASQIGVDASATALVTLAALFGVRLARASTVAFAPWMGLAVGLAVGAKNATSLTVCAVVVLALWPHRKNPRGWYLAGAALLAGALIGSISLLTGSQRAAYPTGWTMAGEWASPTMMGEHLVNLARFSIGLPAAIIGVWGLWRLTRIDARAGRIFVAALAASVLALVPQGPALMRNHLTLAPFVVLGAGYALSGFRPAIQWPLGLLALSFGLAGSLAQVHFMLSPHSANLALAVVQNSAAPGETISRVTEDIPPIDKHVHPPGPNPLAGNLAANAPDWVVMTDLPTTEVSEANRDFLARRYHAIAIFRPERIFGWATLGETGAPPDWKYTHPTITLYRQKR